MTWREVPLGSVCGPPRTVTWRPPDAEHDHEPFHGIMKGLTVNLEQHSAESPRVERVTLSELRYILLW